MKKTWLVSIHKNNPVSGLHTTFDYVAELTEMEATSIHELGNITAFPIDIVKEYSEMVEIIMSLPEESKYERATL